MVVKTSRVRCIYSTSQQSTQNGFMVQVKSKYIAPHTSMQTFLHFTKTRNALVLSIRTEVLVNQVPCFCLVSGQHMEDGLCWDTLLKSSCSGRMTQCLDNLSHNFHWHRSTNKHHTISVLGFSKSQITKLSKWLPGYIINMRVLHILCNHVWDTCCDVSNLLLELVPFWHIAICMAQISGMK